MITTAGAIVTGSLGWEALTGPVKDAAGDGKIICLEVTVSVVLPVTIESNGAVGD